MAWIYNGTDFNRMQRLDPWQLFSRLLLSCEWCYKHDESETAV